MHGETLAVIPSNFASSVNFSRLPCSQILPELANSHNRVVDQVKLEADQNKDRAITAENENMTLTQRVQTLESDLSLSRKETPRWDAGDNLVFNSLVARSTSIWNSPTA